MHALTGCAWASFICGHVADEEEGQEREKKKKSRSETKKKKEQKKDSKWIGDKK